MSVGSTLRSIEENQYYSDKGHKKTFHLFHNIFCHFSFKKVSILKYRFRRYLSKINSFHEKVLKYVISKKHDNIEKV